VCQKVLLYLATRTESAPFNIKLHLKGFIKLYRDRLPDMWKYPITMHLLLYIASKVKRTNSPGNNLEIGEVFLENCENIGITRQEYRTAIKRLTDMKIVEFTSTKRGTKARLIDVSIYDPNLENSNQALNQDGNHVNINEATKEATNREDASNLIEERDTSEEKIESNQGSNQVNLNESTKVLTKEATTNKEVIKNDLKKKIKKEDGDAASSSSVPSLFGDEEKQKNCLFKNSPFKDFEEFEKKFSGAEFSSVDIFHYYNAVKDWSSAKNKKSYDWIATATTWMRKDNNVGKLRIKQEIKEDQSQVQIDKMNRFFKM
jgi:hypothetical protein